MPSTSLRACTLTSTSNRKAAADAGVHAGIQGLATGRSTFRARRRSLGNEQLVEVVRACRGGMKREFELRLARVFSGGCVSVRSQASSRMRYSASVLRRCGFAYCDRVELRGRCSWSRRARGGGHKRQNEEFLRHLARKGSAHSARRQRHSSPCSHLSLTREAGRGKTAR